MSDRYLTATVVALALLSMAPSSASAGFSDVETTQLISRSATGDLPNGPSGNAVISHDRRANRVIAFESDASDIAAGVLPGLTNIYIVNRGGSFSAESAERWQIGATQLVSQGLDGPANGRSYGPAVDGNFAADASCVAFISNATNLVPGDTNGVPDAFVYHLSSGKIERVSVNSRGEQANGASYDVAVDGHCDRVAFTSDATNLALTHTSRKQAKLLTTRAPGGGPKQVYVRQLKGHNRSGRKLAGLTWLASASTRKSPGDGNSSAPSFAIDVNDLLTFQSDATNLAPGGGNGVTQVYVRRFQAPAETGRVSTNASGEQGNGASTRPQFGATGEFVVFQTDATNIVSGDTDPLTDAVRVQLQRRGGKGARAAAAPAHFRPRTIATLGADVGATGPSDSASFSPKVTDAGTFITFQSSPSNVAAFTGEATSIPGAPMMADPNSYRIVPAARDLAPASQIFTRSLTIGEVYIDSRDSRGPHSGALVSPSDQPAASAKANYVLMRTADPFADRVFVAAKHPDWLANKPAIRAQAASNPIFRQVYMHYLGP
ncbi:MAG TPA: hypothetical protein VHE14_07585 [Solirubrobacteraceae bacterium]|nr:hypothetical protein [Solirubrobacteraceae bacterium]